MVANKIITEVHIDMGSSAQKAREKDPRIICIEKAKVKQVPGNKKKKGTHW